MVAASHIDATFDVRTDAGGRDPDRYSKTLRRYHQQLWSKPLPNGARFDLDAQLHHYSDLGEFWLSSDSIVHTYEGWVRPSQLPAVLAAVSEEDQSAFLDLACTVGAFVVFPTSTFVDGKLQQTVNQRRGMHARIRDRFDLTLECIRRHYIGADSPLAKVLDVHAAFFDLFQTFRGYVEYFLLQDLVDENEDSVRFFVGFEDFSRDPVPAASPDEYREYMRRSMAFTQARNVRIAAYSANRPRS